MAFHLARLFPEALVVGADISEGMLSVARRKLAEADDEVRCRMKFTQADCLALPFSDSTFEAVTVAYGVRNFQELESGYREMHRVLMPGGVLCVIELSSPRGGLSKALYDLYIEDKSHRIRQSTLDNTKCVFNTHILPYFKNKPINSITPTDNM